MVYIMFNNLYNEQFSLYLKDLRKKTRIPQSEITARTGLNPDTIRRIESGSVIPRYETLALLSDVYKIDLIRKFTEYRQELNMINIYSEIDRCLLNYDLSSLYDLDRKIKSEEFKNSIKSMLINPDEVLQLQNYIEVLILHFSECDVSYHDTIEKLADTLRMTITEFNITCYRKCKYNAFEIRILLLYALMWCKQDSYKISNEILTFILEWIEFIFENDVIKIKYLIKVHFNLSQNYHMMYKYSDSLRHADIGIKLGTEHKDFSELHALYYRKFTSEYNLMNASYLVSLRKCFFLLEITENKNLLTTYAKITQEKYGIDIYELFSYLK